MDIIEITNKLNELAADTNSFKNLQIIRSELRNLDRPRTYKIFSASTVFEGDGAYAFHDGGRSEIQFNIGIEDFEGDEIFRYGLGFSLEPNQSQPDPINYLTPKIYAFNEFIRNDAGLLNGLSLWHYQHENTHARTPDFPISEIPNDWIKWGNFIFAGRYFRKNIEDINEEDLITMISLFDRLMPVYEYVEREHLKFILSSNGERISRICWNSKGWIGPSGRKGKSKDQNTHEGIYGYGHEEWLCDTSKVLDGYHYAFLESIRGTEDKASGKKYDIDLFSIDSESGNRYAVGKISNVEIIDSGTAGTIKNEYASRGWLKEMENQVIMAGANNAGCSEWPGLNLFNVRFRLNDMNMFEEYRLIDDEKIEKINRYELVHKANEISLKVPISAAMVFKPDTAKEDEMGSEVDYSIYERKPGPVENIYLHKKIRDLLKNHLIDNYGFCVGKECSTGQGTLVDVVRERNGLKIFYEIKAYNSIKSCIREALGQLLEYAYWPDNDNAGVMIIVGIRPMTEDSRLYLKKLRDKYNLPLYYQQFDVEARKLVDGDFPEEVM